jgi:MoxR-like ATPase
MDNIKIVNQLNDSKEKLFDMISKVIIGQKDVIDHLFIALLCRGHILLEGVPGLAKTLLIKTLSEALDLDFNRIQFTPDLMPSDITGTDIIEEDQATAKRNFRFFKGPIFANVILADEINRTPPKTQSALLEAMQESRVTTGGNTYTLDQPFFVLATQNPIEQEGTYPLPEAQLDRFMFNILIDYPDKLEEVEIVKRLTSSNPESIEPVISKEELSAFQDLIKHVPVAENVIEHAVNLVAMTRPSDECAPKITQDWLEWGAGPRASTFLVMAAQAKCLLSGKTTPDIDDINNVAKPVLRHRIITNFTAEADGVSKEDILDQLIALTKA